MSEQIRARKCCLVQNKRRTNKSREGEQYNHSVYSRNSGNNEGSQSFYSATQTHGGHGGLVSQFREDVAKMGPPQRVSTKKRHSNVRYDDDGEDAKSIRRLKKSASNAGTKKQAQAALSSSPNHEGSKFHLVPVKATKTDDPLVDVQSQN